MRLTLRTLLAYMDDILEPADHEDLGKKIESSDFATELIHRSRDTVRRLRLGAPAVLAEDSQDVLGGEDLTADANTVAEYLDNTLSPERVAEFERICLDAGTEADMHLAEVASCHHILTMVLGEPAEIGVEVRDRMYRLPEESERSKTLRIEPSHQAPAAEQAQPAAPIAIAPAEPEPEVAASGTEVPDYLRAATQERHRRIRYVALACILAVIGGLGYFLFRPVPEPELPSEIAGADVPDLGAGLNIEIESGDQAAETEGGSDTTAPLFQAEEPAEQPAGDEVETSTTPEPPSETTRDDVEPDSPPAELATDSGPTDTTSLRNPEAVSATDTTPATEGSLATDSAATSSDPPLPPPVDPNDPLVFDSEEPAEEASVAATELDDEEDSTPPDPVGPIQVGSYLGGASDVLLRRDSIMEKWVRLPPRTAVVAEDHLLTLPTFRPHISFQGGNIYLAGGTQMMFSEPEEATDDYAVELRVLYGRLLINAGLNGEQVPLVIGDQHRLMQLGGSASLALEVRRVFIPGSDFEQESMPIEASWYLTSGSLQVPGPAGGEQTIEAPAMWQTIEGVDSLPEPIDELPEWIDHEEVTDLERRAKKTMADQLEPGAPVGLTLLELNDPAALGRRREVRTLAARSSLHVGQFEPFVKSLSDTDQSRAWESHIDSLRAAMALSPIVASQVRDAFENLRGREAADDLMEMVRGYSRQEVGLTREDQQDGALPRLLEWLDSDSLDYRVLAIHNLNEITGTSYLAGYRADADSTLRQRSLRKLWDRFEDNELLPADY